MYISKKKERTLKAVENLDFGEQSRAGLGVDIIETDRMEQAIKRTPRFVERVFTDGEREYAFGKARPAVHYALFFAAREAVLKALGIGFSEATSWKDVEVAHDKRGRPYPILSGHALDVAHEQGVVDMQLSLSYTHNVGVASAVAIKETDRPRPNDDVDPRKDLEQRFKEMRAMLDDMENELHNGEVASVPDDTDKSGTADAVMDGDSTIGVNAAADADNSGEPAD
ncbi:MAG: holo-ACP synthase [Coriobacteriales bacterium]|jgi:holo-[acyl-carrier protein] synthase|nr:holo-ACP synthase [Coriobacteriales bacterium]